MSAFPLKSSRSDLSRSYANCSGKIPAAQCGYVRRLARRRRVEARAGNPPRLHLLRLRSEVVRQDHFENQCVGSGGKPVSDPEIDAQRIGLIVDDCKKRLPLPAGRL